MPNMELINRGKRIKTLVRDFFDKGHKSGNKLYEDLGTPDVDYTSPNFAINAADSLYRLSECAESQQHRLNATGKTNYDMALLLLKMPVTDRSGNCYEMAILSAYYAMKIECLNRSLLYIGSIKDPGDHVFCLVATDKIAASRLSYASVNSFTSDNMARAWLVIDPWLNTTCGADDYLNQSGAKLDKWTADGKRVSWTGSQGSGWYPPGGEYKRVFATAPVTLEPF